VLSKAFPLLSIVVLLFPMIVFMFASPPLLVLKHDTPVDSRFIRNLFNVYYIVVMTIATLDATGFAFRGQSAATLALGGLIVFVFVLRRWVISNMDKLRDAMTRGDPMAVPRFRRLHIAGMVLNVCQLGAVASGMTRLAT
jgi:hypothetical protein